MGHLTPAVRQNMVPWLLPRGGQDGRSSAGRKPGEEAGAAVTPVKGVLLRHVSGALEARRLAAVSSEDPSRQWDLSTGLEAVTPSLVAPVDGLDELAVPKCSAAKSSAAIRQAALASPQAGEERPVACVS